MLEGKLDNILEIAKATKLYNNEVQSRVKSKLRKV